MLKVRIDAPGSTKKYDQTNKEKYIDGSHRIEFGKDGGRFQTNHGQDYDQAQRNCLVIKIGIIVNGLRGGFIATIPSVTATIVEEISCVGQV